MSIFIDSGTRLIVQGITGRDGSFHTKQMIEYGTTVVGGVTPGKGGQKFEGTVPIFNTVAEAVKATSANTTVIYVPPPFAADAMMEAADAGVSLIVAITEGVPVMDMTRVHPFVRERGARLLGPNCPGLISPGKSKVGIIPGRICTPGSIGLVSRSGTLTYEVVYQMTRAGLGQTTCVGIGGDPSVKVILFNIFGGITRTDDVANGIVTATRANPLRIPIVIRLTGTNEEIAMKILQDNGFSASSDMDEAVQKAVALATKGGKAA